MSGDCRVRRDALFILICVLAGVVMNVAVGWGCAVFMDPQLSEADERVGGSLLGAGYWNWRIWRHRAPGALRVMSQWSDKPTLAAAQADVKDSPSDRLIPRWALFATPAYELPTGAHHYCVAQARGWPCLSLTGGAHLTIKLLGTSDSDGESQLISALALDRDRLGDPQQHWQLRLLPLRPLWFGFAANTFFYGVIIWMLLNALFALRRFVDVGFGHATTGKAQPDKSSEAATQVQ
jgi:hypothetical protein